MFNINFDTTIDKRYYGFFGKLGKAEDRIFNDPNFTNKYRYTSGNSAYVR
jgi:hypothetical protein